MGTEKGSRPGRENDRSDEKTWAPSGYTRAKKDRDDLVKAAVRIVTAWPDDPEALTCGSTLLLKARRITYEIRAAA